MRSVLRFLRSPRLAFALVLGIAAYGALGTLVPQPASDPRAAAAWILAHPSVARLAGLLGLFSAFTSPLFLLGLALLAASLLECSRQRVRAAVRMLRDSPAGPGLRAAIERHPALVAGPVAAEEDVLAPVAAALAVAGFRVRSADHVLGASRRRWGALGSPAFHLSLVALLVVITIGQLTRADGFLPVPIGGRAVDAAESYESVHTGPWFGGSTGLSFGASDLSSRTVVAGLDRGPSAVIAIYGGGGALARGRVYPNSPLRYGTLLVHPDTWGYGPLLTLETTSGRTVSRVRGFIPASAVTSDGAGPGSVTFSGGVLGRAAIEFSIPAERVGADGMPVLARALRVSVRRDDEQTTMPVVIAEGRRIALAAGLWLRFAERGTSVRVIVTNDWSVPYIYALFGIACLALGVALVFPPGKAWAMMIEKDGARYVHVVTAGSRLDPGLRRRVAEIVREALPYDVEVR